MISWPFDSQISGYETDGTPIYDRAVDSVVLSRMFGRLFGNGIFPNLATGMQVIAGDGTMETIVKAGSCLINGRIGIEDTDRTMKHTAASSSDRIDRVVVRLDLNTDQRDIDFYVVAGMPATSPVAPELTRNSSVYELSLALVFIPKNTNQINDERITDTRLDSAVCGLVVTDPDGIDTSQMYKQLQAAFIAFDTNFVAGQEQWKETQRAAFDAWFASLKIDLSGDVAGILQLQLDSITSATDTEIDAMF